MKTEKLWYNKNFLDYAMNGECITRSYFRRDIERLRERLDNDKDLRNFLKKGERFSVERAYYIDNILFLVHWLYYFDSDQNQYIFCLNYVVETGCGSSNHHLLTDSGESLWQ